MSIFGEIGKVTETVLENTELKQQLNLGTILGSTAGQLGDILKIMRGAHQKSLTEFPDAELLLDDLFKTEPENKEVPTQATPVVPVDDQTKR